MVEISEGFVGGYVFLFGGCAGCHGRVHDQCGEQAEVLWRRDVCWSGCAIAGCDGALEERDGL